MKKNKSPRGQVFTEKSIRDFVGVRIASSGVTHMVGKCRKMKFHAVTNHRMMSFV